MRNKSRSGCGGEQRRPEKTIEHHCDFKLPSKVIK